MYFINLNHTNLTTILIAEEYNWQNIFSGLKTGLRGTLA